MASFQPTEGHTSKSHGGEAYVVCGFAGDPIAEQTAKLLNKPLMLIQNGTFNDTSSNVRFDTKQPRSLEDKKVCLIAGNCQRGGKSINDTTMEIYLAVDAAKRAGAKEVNVYMPHLGYARQDKVSQPGEPLAAHLTLKLLAAAGADKVTVLDIHNDAVFGALESHATGINRFAMPQFAERFVEMRNRGVKLDKLVVVAPDKGAIDRARLFQSAMLTAGFAGTAFAFFDKSRDMSKKGEVQTMGLREVHLPTGEILLDEKAEEAFAGQTAIVIDDMADTCGTILRAITDNIVKRCQAKEAYAVITHGVLSGNALEKIGKTKELTKMFVTDSIPLRQAAPHNLEVVSCAPVFAEAIESSMNS